jgi:H+/Cl- antiporter ClcA
MQTKIKWCGYAILSGLLSGLAAALFLSSLQFLTQFRIDHPALVYGLPFAGLFIGLIYHHYGKEIQPGTTLILDEISSPKKVTPIRMAPAIFFTTLLNHLFGGSAGREGTVVQMGASLSDQLSRFFSISQLERRILLVAGMGAGFGAALGTPFAGIFFGMEIMRQGKFRLFSIVECSLASFVAYGVTMLLRAPHTHFPEVVFAFSWKALLWTLLASLLFALIARVFLTTEHELERLFFKRISYAPLKPFIGGIVLLILFKGFHWEGYEGLGLETLLRSFQVNFSPYVTLIKLVLTAITLASGFKGGEFIPLIFMGATAGSYLAGLTDLPLAFLPALGCVGVFSAASKAPIASSIVAIELFGWQIAPFAILTCFLGAAVSGEKTIYRKQ